MKDLKPISEIIKQLNIDDTSVYYFGKHIAKIDYTLLKKLEHKKDGKLILVTAITPTKKGEGKTTVTIGLGMALSKLNKKTIICLREPSLGPIFGVKGGACGGGKATVEPMQAINFHFTGDFRAVTAANNLLAASIDNHIFHGNALNIDPKNIFWKRCLDMNDRSLRKISYKINDEIVETGFEISAASEIMAILCLAKDMDDLKKRLGNIIIGLDKNGDEVFAKQLHVDGAMTALLVDAINPNIAQTAEHTPVFVHGGPFGNIAHGTNSLIATKLALKLSDYVVTEAGFGADLGAEKFFDIVCRVGNIKPSCVVLVATIKALKLHGGAIDLKKEDLAALRKGLANLDKQVENLQMMGMNVVIAINKFDDDSSNEIRLLENVCNFADIPGELKNNICNPFQTPIVMAEVFQKGGLGGFELAKKIVECRDSAKINYLYELDEPLKDKIEKVAVKIYGAKKVEYSELASIKINRIGQRYELPICIAKTQSSLSDDPLLLGRPSDFTFKVTDLKVAAGAGYIVVYAGNIMTMPGLPEKPNAESIDVVDGEIRGLF